MPKQQQSKTSTPGEFTCVYLTLQEDINRIYPYTAHEDTGKVSYPSPLYLDASERRSLVRAVFAYIEGNAYFMRQMLLRSGAGTTLPAPTILALSELQVEVTGGGEVQTKTLRTGAVSMLKLTLNSFASVYPILPEEMCTAHEFEALARSSRVRDRLMHPKSAESLTVTDSEITEVVSAFTGFSFKLAACIRAASDALQSQLAEHGLHLEVAWTQDQSSNGKGA